MAESAIQYAVCEINDVRDDLKIGSDDTSFDDSLRRLINSVSRTIEDYTGKYFAARDIAAEKYDGKGTAILILRRTPVIRISTLLNDTITVDADDFVFYPDTGKVQLTDGTAFVCGPQKVSVTYRCGYDRQDMPDNVAEAARLWVCHKFKIGDKQRWGVNSQTVNEESFSFSTGEMPPEVREILDMYRGL